MFDKDFVLNFIEHRLLIDVLKCPFTIDELRTVVQKAEHLADVFLFIEQKQSALIERISTAIMNPSTDAYVYRVVDAWWRNNRSPLGESKRYWDSMARSDCNFQDLLESRNGFSVLRDEVHEDNLLQNLDVMVQFDVLPTEEDLFFKEDHKGYLVTLPVAAKCFIDSSTHSSTMNTLFEQVCSSNSNKNGYILQRFFDRVLYKERSKIISTETMPVLNYSDYFRKFTEQFIASNFDSSQHKYNIPELHKQLRSTNVAQSQILRDKELMFCLEILGADPEFFLWHGVLHCEIIMHFGPDMFYLPVQVRETARSFDEFRID